MRSWSRTLAALAAAAAFSGCSMFQVNDKGPLVCATAGDIVSVKVSSERGVNTAEKAVDCDRTTRWESLHGIDKSWLIIELKPGRIIESMKIYWERAGAAEYDIRFSNDLKEWKTVYAVFDGRESDEKGIKFPPTAARYVGIFCKKRLGEYGYSILDIELNPQMLLPEEKVGLAGATASSSEASSPMDAIDGSASSRWGSKQAVDPQWLQVKLDPSPQKIRAVKIAWEKASAKKYEIQVSMDGNAWKTVSAINDGKESETRTIFFSPVEMSYLRVFGTSRNGEWGYSIWELEVYR
jgi:hypothetical protein